MKFRMATIKVDNFLRPFRGEGHGELGSVLGEIPGHGGDTGVGRRAQENEKLPSR